MSDVTQILHAIENGEPQATDELLPVVYMELRRVAAKQLKGEGAGHTLQPTALVHEAYVRLVDTSDPQVPHQSRVSSADDAEAFLAEVRIVAGLDHPNIVPVHDMGRTDDQ